MGINFKNWFALVRAEGIGPVKFKKYLSKDPELNNLPVGLKIDWQGVKKDLTWLEKDNCHVVLFTDKRYPINLKQINSSPPILFVKGNINNLNTMQIAIVGSRKASVLGKEQAYNFAKDLVDYGITVTSGLAEGIDTKSHIGAIDGNGKTIAVLGSGIDYIYPSRNKYLADLILASGGTIVSEFPVGIRPVASNFPRRNRIISGLSRGVLVVEASLKSGSLITAKYALEQNREVFAVPGSINNIFAKGCHQLIRQGAKLVENTTDILEELGAFLKSTSCAKKQVNDINLSEVESSVLDNIDYAITPVDIIIARCKDSAEKILQIIMQLEILGKIVAAPGGYARSLG